MRIEPGRVLVVDDDRMNRMMLTRSLQHAGHCIVAVESGREGLEQLREQPFDVVLLDVRMPEMDGFEVLDEIMRDESLRDIPVIMVSGIDEVSHVVTCIEMGAADYLHKPFDPGLLRARLDNSLEKKRSRDLLQESYRQLKELEQLRDSLTHMIVHDLRQPLQALMGGLQTLDMMGDLNPQQHEFVEMSVQGGETLLGMINDLLDISRMESGSLTLDRSAINPEQVIEEAIRQVRQLAEQKGLRIVPAIESGLPVCRADRDKLRRILVNLLGNAIKFTPKQGTVTVRVGPNAERSALCCSVEDTGEGIPQEAFALIFEKFGQVSNRKSGLQSSSGLGLTFCKMAVEAHGGTIWVESTLGQGSKFSFSIPLQAA